MATRRFEVTRVSEPISDNVSQSPEMIPLIHTENEIPSSSSSSSPSSKLGKNTNRMSSRLFNTILQRKSLDTQRYTTNIETDTSMNTKVKKSSSFDIIEKFDSTSKLPTITNMNENDESDVYSTIQSNNYDTNQLSKTNKFLQELRSKRRELREKAKNISIDQRIAFHRQENQREILRAQDIFDVHFEINNEDSNINASVSQLNIFTEESQEKIRNEIFNELNRQQEKKYYKHHRHLLLGRSLLMFMTSLLAFMSFTLIYAVSDLYNRANYSEAKLPTIEFISMINDKTTDFY